MDEKSKAILNRHRQLLVTNIILTEEFYDLLQTERVLPDVMIKDVKSGFDQEERNSRLLNALFLRTSLTFRRFRAVLLKSGHHFLADLLWEEDYDNTAMGESILQNFSAIFDKLPDDTRRKVVLYLDSKIKEKALQIAWRTTSVDRVAALHNRSSDYKHEKALRETLDEQDKQLMSVKNEICSKDERIRLLTIEIQGLKREIETIKNNNQKELEKQTNFNSANNSAVMRLKERFVAFNDIIIKLNQSVRNFLGDEPESSRSEADNVKLSYLDRNLHRVLHKAREAQKSSDLYATQKQETIKLLKKSDQKSSIVEMVKEHIENEQNAKNSLWRDIEKLSDAIKGLPKTGILQKRISTDGVVTDMRYLKNHVATIRVEVEHLHKKMLWKDNQIKELKSEIYSYKNRLPKVIKTPPPSPDLNYEMNFDDYINYNPTENGDKIKNGGIESYQPIPVTSPRLFVNNKQERHVVFSDVRQKSSSPIKQTSLLKSALLSDHTTLPPVE